MAGRLRRLGGKAQGRGRHAAAETDVGQPRLAVDNHPQRHMRARHRRRIGRPHPAHPRRQALNRKPDCGERAHQQAILLEAITATASRDHLGVDGFGREIDAAAKQHVDRLEGNCRRMQLMQRTQGIERGLARTRIANARAIGVEVDGRHGLGWRRPRRQSHVTHLLKNLTNVQRPSTARAPCGRADRAAARGRRCD